MFETFHGEVREHFIHIKVLRPLELKLPDIGMQVYKSFSVGIVSHKLFRSQANSLHGQKLFTEIFTLNKILTKLGAPLKLILQNI